VHIIRSDTLPVDKHLFDIIKINKDIKLIVPIPFVKKKEIKLTAIGKRMEIFAKTKSGPYHKYFHIPSGADVHSAKSRYNNGILEITFSKKWHQNAKNSKNRNRVRHYTRCGCR
jgi:HSP20 family protein